MSSHLPLARLEPHSRDSLTPVELAHLARCPRCRVEARLLAEAHGEVPADLPGLDTARQSLDLTRSGIGLGMSSHTHVEHEAPLSSLSGLLGDHAPSTHYTMESPIGMGGMGEVWRVKDERLERTVAMKWLRPGRLRHRSIVSRFLQEARLTARLQHPGVVAVHELGQLPDGRPYFTMKEVRGRTLQEVLHEIHLASRGAQAWQAGPSGFTFRRTVDAFLRACEAVAYAHSQGVIHRDLKPSNIMVGAYGEVQVLDWGLARVLGEPEAPADPAEATDPDADHPTPITRSPLVDVTTAGSVVGTLPFMPPEQARGEIHALGPPADVYALGATLYQLLSGRPPYVGTSAEVATALLTGPPQPVEAAAAEATLPPLPEALVRLCTRAMAREPADRFPDASALAREVEAFLDGARRREEALEVVGRATALLPQLARLREEAAALRLEVSSGWATLPPDAPLAAKRPLWAREDDLAALEAEIAVHEVRYLQLLRGALTREPDLPEAHDRLADAYHAEHVAAEARRDTAQADRLRLLLEEHGRARYADYLKGDGRLTLVTEPPGARVALSRLSRRDRRLVAEGPPELLTTPLEDVPLARGSYLLELDAPGRAPVVYPVAIGRLERWDGRRPGGARPLVVPLPLEGAVGPGDIHVPAGWCVTGGDPEAAQAWPRRRIWVDGFVIRRHPVTNGEYLVFLNDLITRGEEDEALRRAPRERAGAGERGALLYARDEDGRFRLTADADADAWQPDWPVMMIDWFDAMAYARWVSEKTGRAWRLPHELEWEKAARGVDGRFFPWGDDFEPLYTCMRLSPPGRKTPASIHDFPLDVSPYGVRGLAGNVGDWCLNPFDAPPPEDGEILIVRPDTDGVDERAPRSKRGGSWQHDARILRAAERHGLAPTYHSSILGFRLVR